MGWGNCMKCLKMGWNEKGWGKKFKKRGMLGKGISASCSVSEELHIGEIVTLVHKVKKQTGVFKTANVFSFQYKKAKPNISAKI